MGKDAKKEERREEDGRKGLDVAEDGPGGECVETLERLQIRKAEGKAL